MPNIKVYTTTYCPYCTRAKELLTSESIAFEEIDVTHDQEARAKLSKENSGYRTVPMIFFDDEFIGGFKELTKIQKTDKWAELKSS